MRTISYYPTPLEDWVSLRLMQSGILEASQLDEESVCDAFDIFYKELNKGSHSVEIGHLKLITINSMLDKKKKREQFYHELCHVLRHAGHQMNMPETFRQWQEWDAVNFTRYASLPIHMLKDYNLSDYDIVTQLSDDFCIPVEIVVDRLQRIKLRSQQYTYTLVREEKHHEKSSNVFKEITC